MIKNCCCCLAAQSCALEYACVSGASVRYSVTGVGGVNRSMPPPSEHTQNYTHNLPNASCTRSQAYLLGNGGRRYCCYCCYAVTFGKAHLFNELVSRPGRHAPHLKRERARKGKELEREVITHIQSREAKITFSLVSSTRQLSASPSLLLFGQHRGLFVLTLPAAWS